jgi:hypothetical protein
MKYLNKNKRNSSENLLMSNYLTYRNTRKKFLYKLKNN